MSQILQILKLASTAPVQSGAPAPAPAPVAPTSEAAPKPPPQVVGGLVKAPTVMPSAGGGGGYTVNHPVHSNGALGGGAIDTAQVEQQQAMQEQQLADTQLKADQASKQLAETEKTMQNQQKQFFTSMHDRLKMAGTDLAHQGPFNPESPTGAAPAPGVDLSGAVSSDNPLYGAYNWARKAGLNSLWSRFAPKPMGNITDLNTRFGRNYWDAAEDIGRMSQKQPPGLALLGNLAGSLISKYNGGGRDLSEIGTDAASVVGKVTGSV